MDKNQEKLIKPLTWLTFTGFCLVSLFAAPALQSNFWPGRTGQYSVNTASELKRLEILDTLSEHDLTELAHYQDTYHVTLPNVFKDPYWVNRLGLTSRKFRATWYISNPYDLLPKGLKTALQHKSKPFHKQAQVWQWCKEQKFPPSWREALKAALIETTPENLWRAARGRKPYAKNGKYLQPIVIEHEPGMLEVKDGHIATDPRVISLNSEVILLVRINGADQILRVTAADIGGRVKGYHVDLPIKMHPGGRSISNAKLPAEKIRNANVEILTTIKKRTNPNRKA